MSSRELYRRFISLCKKWPKDESKIGRDYGEYFREIIGSQFPHGELGEVKDAKLVENYLKSLEKLANNNYFNENPLKRSSASGLEVWACRTAISNEGLRQINDEDENSVFQRLKGTLGVKYLNDK